MYGQDCHKDFKLDTVYVDVIEDISVYIIDTISYESLIIDSLYTDNITEFVYLSNTVGDTMVVRVIEHVERVTTDTLYLDVPEYKAEYVEVYVTKDLVIHDTIVEIEFKDKLISPNSKIQEVLDKSFGNNVLYDLNGNKIRRPKGVYIENGKIKYIKI